MNDNELSLADLTEDDISILRCFANGGKVYNASWLPLSDRGLLQNHNPGEWPTVTEAGYKFLESLNQEG